MSYTGPVKPTKEQWEKWYHRMKDFINPIHQRGYGIVCNPKDEAMMKDMLERLVDDETWPHDGVPDLVTTKLIPEGQVQPISVEDLKVVRMREVVGSNRGFGRFNGLALPSGMEGLVNPWRIPRGEKPKVIKPDDPDFELGKGPQ